MHALRASLFFLVVSTLGCSEEEPAPIDPNELDFTGRSKVYTLFPDNGSSMTGTVTFAELADASTYITLDMDGTTPGVGHPCHIHTGPATIDGIIEVSFNAVNGDTGMSGTVVTQDDTGSRLTYFDLINYDGHVMVHASGSDNTVLARGDIGGNELTGESQAYGLLEVNNSGISGSVTFEERLNEKALVTVNIVGSAEGESHPAHIHNGSTSESGSIYVSLTNVDGGTGTSVTDVAESDGGARVTYQQLLSFDGNVIVHRSQSDFGTLVARGNIGANATTQLVPGGADPHQ